MKQKTSILLFLTSLLGVCFADRAPEVEGVVKNLPHSDEDFGKLFSELQSRHPDDFGRFKDLLYALYPPSSVQELNEETFNGLLESHDITVIEFYSPGCVHCERIAPEFEKVAKEFSKKYDSLNIGFGKVNGMAFQNLIMQYQVASFPQIKLFKKDFNPITFNNANAGSKPKENIALWIERKLGLVPSTTALTSLEEIEAFLSSAKNPPVIGFFDSTESVHYAQFQQTAQMEELESIPFGEVMMGSEASKQIAARYGITKFPEVRLFRTSIGETDMNYPDTHSADGLKLLPDWVLTASLPSVAEVSPKNFRKYAQLGIPLIAAFIDPQNTATKQFILETFKELAPKYANIFTFGFIDGVTYMDMAKRWGATGHWLPVILELDFESGRNLVFGEDMDITASKSALLEWVDGIATGKIRWEPKSEPIPVLTGDEAVVPVVAKSIYDFVMQDKDVVLEFFAPSLADKIGSHFKGDRDVVIGRIDVTANQIDIPLKGVPTVLLYSREDKKNPLSYSGNGSKEDLIHFVESNRSEPDEILEDDEDELKDELTGQTSQTLRKLLCKKTKIVPFEEQLHEDDQMATLVFTVILEQPSGDIHVVDLKFKSSKDVNVQHLKRLLNVKNDHILSVLKGGIYHIVESEEDLAHVRNGGRLKIEKKQRPHKSFFFKNSSTVPQTSVDGSTNQNLTSPTTSNENNMGLIFSRHAKTDLPGSEADKSNAQTKTTKTENTSTAQQQSTLTTNTDPSPKTERSSNNTNVDNTKTTKTTPSPTTANSVTVSPSQTKSESQQVSKQAEPSNNNNNNEGSDPPPISIFNEWKLGPEDRQSMKTQFLKLDTDQDGFILLEEMNLAFGYSGLDDATLRKIWNLVDIKQLERLDCIQYIICQVLIRNVKEGNELPEALPESFMLAARGEDANESDVRRRSSGLSPQEEAELGALRHTRVRRGAFYQDKSPVSSAPPKLNAALANGLPPESSSGQTKVSKKIKPAEGKIRCNSAFCHVGYADTIGQRAAMEDEIVIHGHFRGREDEDYIAVFDGHGGHESATFMSKCLHNVLEDQLNQNSENPAESLKAAFLKANEALKTERLRGGATGLVSYIQNSKLYIANIGDCRAVLCQGGQPVRVTTDHKASLASEEQRIVSLGGFITTAVDRFGNVISRVCGQLAVTRAFGDFSLEPFVIAEPEVFGPFSLDPKDKVFFLIMACDGVWDKVTDEEAVSIVAPISDPEKAAIKLRDWAFSKGSDDNISVVVVRFPPFLLK